MKFETAYEGKDVVNLAVRAAWLEGWRLREQRGMLPHGAWYEYLDGRGLNPRTASRRMKLASKPISTYARCRSINEAVREAYYGKE